MADPDEPQLPFLHLKANPRIFSQEIARELAAIVIEWGALENVITTDLEQLRMFKVAHDLSDRVPGSFGAKLKLWRRSYVALYPTIKSYHRIADNIFETARIVGLERHRIIHGLWYPEESDPNTFYILPALDRVREVQSIKADVRYLAAVHEDIKKLSDRAWSLNASRQLAGAQGLLQPQLLPSGGHPALQPPPNPEKP
jgi:hypothetical protein